MTAQLPPERASAGWLSATPLTCLIMCLSLSLYCLTSARSMKVKIKLSIIMLLNGVLTSIIVFPSKNIFIVKSWSFATCKLFCTCTDVPLAPRTPILSNAEDNTGSICCCYLEISLWKNKMHINIYIYKYTNESALSELALKLTNGNWLPKIYEKIRACMDAT